MSEPKNTPPYSGSCLCGSVCYAVDKIEPHMGHCHCTMCRKFHGAAFATFGEALTENFRWTKGQEFLKEFVADNGTTRLFCSKCGSSMVFRASGDAGKLVEFSLGTLDSEISEKPDAHIFTDYSACWFEISDDLPRYPEERPG